MPELSALTKAGLPAINYQPINPATYLSPLTPDTSAASALQGKSAMMGVVAKTLADLPTTFQTAYRSGQQMALDRQNIALQNRTNASKMAGLDLKDSVVSGQPLSDSQRTALAGVSFGPDGSTSYKAPGLYDVALDKAKLDDTTSQATLRRAQAAKAAQGTGRYQAVVDAINSGQDPNSAGTVAPATVFGLVPDGKGGYMDDPQDKVDAKVPGFSATHGAYGHNIKDPNLMGVAVTTDEMRAAGLNPDDPNANHEVEVTANGKTMRVPIVDKMGTPGKIDMTYGLYKQMGGADSPNGSIENARYRIVPKGGMPLPAGGAAGDPAARPTMLANSPPHHVDPATGIAYIGQPNGSYLAMDPTGHTMPIKMPASTAAPGKVRLDADTMGIDTTGMSEQQIASAIDEKEKTEGLIRPSRLPVAQRLANQIVTHPALKHLPTIREAKEAVDAGLANPDSGGFSDMALIEGFQRMVNPGATVRTQTMQNMKEAAGWLQQLSPGFQWEKAIQGDKFTPEARAKLKTLADQIYQQSLKTAAPQISGLKKIAKMYGISNPDQFVDNTLSVAPILAGGGEPAAAPTGTPAATPASPAAPAVASPKDQEAIAWVNSAEAQGNPAARDKVIAALHAKGITP